MGQKQCTKDAIGTREYKIILNPARFKDTRLGMQQMWRKVARIARKENGLKSEKKFKFEMDDDCPRKVCFLDTADYGLREKGFVFRVRGRGDDLQGTLKYRNTDYFVSRAKDLSAKKHKKDAQCKFENDLIPNGTVYQTRSNTLVLTKNQVKKLKRVGNLEAIFPAVKKLGIKSKTRLYRVNGFKATEVAYKLDEVLDFSHGVKADACFNFWRGKKKADLKVAEFSFVYKTQDGSVPHQAAQEAQKFLDTLKGLEWWYDPNATTKTALTYGKPGGPAVD